MAEDDRFDSDFSGQVNEHMAKSFESFDAKNLFSEIIPSTAKILDRKLDVDGKQYVSWKKAIQLFLGGIGKREHLTSDPPSDASRLKWMMEDQRLLGFIFNSLDGEVQDNTIHCETVKELWEFLKSLYSGKDSLTQLYDLCQALFHLDGKGKTLSQIYTEYNRIFEQ